MQSRREGSANLGDNGSRKISGTPSIWDRSKTQALGYIKSRIRDKIQGGRTKTLIQAGKHVLIKAVITIISFYVMNVFKLPKTLCS